jgi:hypothetical protein
VRRLALQLTIVFFALTLSIGVACAAEVAANSEGSRASPSQLTAPLSSRRARTRKKRTFKFVYRTCESGCYEKYESSDGQEVSLILACHTSTAREAREEVQRMTSEGRVVRKGWRYYGRGRRRKLAERFVAVYPKDESGEEPAKILWYVEGTCFSYIGAGSLQLALEFERSAVFAKANSW